MITAAVVGTGFIAHVHIEALRRLGIPVAGILGSDEAKSRRAQQELGLPRAYATFDELLQDPAVQVVHIAVPNVLHYDLCRRALAAGKHVMCEKPLTLESRESADLVARAVRAGRHAGVCYNVRYYPLNLHARALLRSNELGRVLAVHGSYTQDWLLKDSDFNWRVLSDRGGPLRAVADIGTHWLYLVQAISGLRLEQVFADLATVHAVRRRPRGGALTFSGRPGAADGAREAVPITNDDCGNVLLRFAGGARGGLYVSQVNAARKNCLRYEIAAERATLAWDSEKPETLWLGRRDSANQSLVRDPALLAPIAQPFANHPGGHVEGFPDTFKQYFRAFYDAIAGRAPADGPGYPTFADGHHEIVLLDAILASHRRQQWMPVASPGALAATA